MDLLRARKLVPVWTTALLLGGCALSHLDLNGGAHVVSTHIADTDLKLFIDDTHPLTLTLVYDDGFEESAQQDSVAWSLDAPGVAAIDGNHQVRGRSRGTATLTAEYDKQIATTLIGTPLLRTMIGESPTIPPIGALPAPTCLATSTPPRPTAKLTSSPASLK